MRVTVRAGALQRLLVERNLRAVMEVEEKRAEVAMLLPARAPMRVRSLGMEERRVRPVSQPRERKVVKRVETEVRKRVEKRVEKRLETKVGKRVEKRVETKVGKMMEKRVEKRVESPRKETGPMTMQLETMELETRVERARNPRRPQLRSPYSVLMPSVRARTLHQGMRKQHLRRCRV